MQPTDPLLSLTLGVMVLRAGPATDWGAVAVLPANTEVELISCFGSGCLSPWLLVRSGETTGWLRTDDIQPVPELDALPTVGRTAKLLPFEMITLLADPRAGATVVATITAADAITVLGRSEAAGRVAILAGRIGWIPASRLDGDAVLLPLYMGSGTTVFDLRAGLLWWQGPDRLLLREPEGLAVLEGVLLSGLAPGRSLMDVNTAGDLGVAQCGSELSEFAFLAVDRLITVGPWPSTGGSDVGNISDRWRWSPAGDAVLIPAHEDGDPVLPLYRVGASPVRLRRGRMAEWISADEILLLDADGDLWRRSVWTDGGETLVLRGVVAVRVSPTRDHVAIEQAAGRAQTGVYRLPEFERVGAAPAGRLLDEGWAPTGRILLVTIGVEDPILHQLEGPEWAPISLGVAADGGIAWAPDGGAIVLEKRLQRSQLVDLRSGTRTDLRLVTSATWAPGGEKFAAQHRAELGSSRITVYARGGQQLLAVTRTANRLGDLQWSADSLRLAFSSRFDLS